MLSDTWKDSVKKKEIKYLWQTDRKDLKKTIEDRLKHGRVLDAGCGFGNVVMHLQKDGVDCYGVDYDPDVLSFAKTKVKYPEKIIEADLRKMPFKDGYFDLVISRLVYDFIRAECGLFGYEEYLPQVEEILKGTSRVIKRGGIYCVTDPFELRGSVKDMHLRYFNLLSIGYANAIFEKPKKPRTIE